MKKYKFFVEDYTHMVHENIEDQIKERLISEGGMFYRKVHPSKIILTEVDRDILKTIAQCYKLRQPLLLEGDPGTGKTVLLELFFQLIHGGNEPILTLYCTPEGKDAKVALIEAYSGRDGRGNILLVEHLNVIYPSYQTIFRQIGGDKGDLSESIQFDGKIYRRGKATWICFTCNFPEKTPGCNVVEPGLADRVVWKVITDEDAKKKRDALLDCGFGR